MIGLLEKYIAPERYRRLNPLRGDAEELRVEILNCADRGCAIIFYSLRKKSDNLIGKMKDEGMCKMEVRKYDKKLKSALEEID